MDFSIKTYISIGSLILMTSFSAKASQIFYAPAFCDPKDLTLTVTNNTREPQRLWTQVHFPEMIDEINFDLQGKSQVKIRGTQFLPMKMAFSLKTWEQNSLSIKASCFGAESAALTDSTSPLVTHYIPASSEAVQVSLLNLYLKKQNVELRALSASGEVLAHQEVTLEKYYDTTTFKWSVPKSTARIELAGEHRLHSWLHFDSGWNFQQSPGLPRAVTLKVDTEKAYFLVSTRDPSPEEGFVIALDQADLIATARQQVQNPDLHKILVAGIELGNGGYNRAMLSRDKSPYSWSVTRVDAFADFAHIDCDGSPNIVEERLSQRLNEGGGRICFWRYRIVRELTPAEINSGTLR